MTSQPNYYDRPGFTPVTRRNPCQICGNTGFCEISLDGTTAHCMKVASDRPTSFRLGGWFHQLKPDFTFEAVNIHSLRLNTTATTITLEQLDQVNQRFAQLCGELTDHHKQFLLSEMVDPKYCRSWNMIDSRYLATALIELIVRRPNFTIIENSVGAGSGPKVRFLFAVHRYSKPDVFCPV